MNLTTHQVTVGLYLLMVFLAVVLWFATSDNHNSKVASVANLLRHVLRSRATRIGVTLFWWWLGVHFLFSHIHGR
jgi:hypothetical protein